MGLKKVFTNNVETYNSSSTLYDGLGERIIEKLNSQKFHWDNIIESYKRIL